MSSPSPNIRLLGHWAFALVLALACSEPTPSLAGGTADGFVNIGTTAVPTSMLGVYGAQTIGQSYFLTAAPANGLLVQGNVGIGTTSPYVSIDLHSKTDALALPIGTTGQEPSTPLNGMIRYNTTLTDVEAYIGGYWTTLTTGGSAANIYLGTSNLLPNPASSASDTQTGLYTAGAGKVDFTSIGTQIVEISSTGMNVVTGSVGIGTASPSQALQVGGTNYAAISSSGNLSFGGTGGYSVANNAYAFSAAANSLVGLYFNYSQLGYQFLNTLGTSVMHIGLGGAVGIGTTSPTAGLEISGGLSGDLLKLSATGVSEPLYYLNISNRVVSSGNIAYDLTVKNNTNTYNEMTFGNNGKIGVGTNAPSNLLDVAGGEAIGLSYVGTNTAPTNGLLVQGNVGVGTTAPQATLDVNGYVKLALNSSQPASCSTTNDGSLALTHTHNTCVCVGASAAWVSTVTGGNCAW